MLCLQTSCHRCPSALHNRLVTSTPPLSPLSLIHHLRFNASSGPLAARALPRAPSREPRPSREKRWRGHRPGRSGGVPAEEKTRRRSRRLRRSRRWRTGPVARGPTREKRTYHRYAVAARKCYVVSLNYPQKTPRRERDASAAAPGPPSSRAPSRVSPRPRPASRARPRRTRSPSPRRALVNLRPSARRRRSPP